MASFKDADKIVPVLGKANTPREHGNYLPALQALGDLLAGCSPALTTSVLFFSDGKPSDSPPAGRGTAADKTRDQIVRTTEKAFRGQDPKTFRFHTVGFGPDNFATLKAMAQALPVGVGAFHESGLNLQSLKSTLASFSSSITETLLTVTPGPQRALSPVKKSAITAKWIVHRDVSGYKAPMDVDAAWEKFPRKYNVKIAETVFGSGGERNAFDCRFLGHPTIPATEQWVAKRNKYVEPDRQKELDFHRKNLVVQSQAGAYAAMFNRKVKEHERVRVLPGVEFLPAYLLVLEDGSYVFVEGKLTSNKFTKVGCIFHHPPHSSLFASPRSHHRVRDCFCNSQN